MNYLMVFLGAYLSLYQPGVDHQDVDISSRLLPLQTGTTTKTTRIDDLWNQWKGMHNKTYSEDIDYLKKIIFNSNAQKVADFNRDHAKELGFELALNHLADMSEIELKQINGFRLTPQLNVADPGVKMRSNSLRQQLFLNKILSNDSIEVPDEVDWRKTPGRVSQVKNQGQCGSCWAFATTGMLEGQELVRRQKLADEYRDNKDIVELSEQNLVDCVTKDYGCNGGLMIDALNFIKDEGGIDDEQSYPYEAKTRKCRFRKDKIAFKDSGAAVLPTGDEQKLKEMVAKYGPVSVAIDASSIFFQLYHGGVFKSWTCRNSEKALDHAVLVVGYGTDPKKGDYWIVKNSWGPHWGEKGYIRMARNRRNMCGIATMATIATF